MFGADCGSYHKEYLKRRNQAQVECSKLLNSLPNDKSLRSFVLKCKDDDFYSVQPQYDAHWDEPVSNVDREKYWHALRAVCMVDIQGETPHWLLKQLQRFHKLSYEERSVLYHDCALVDNFVFFDMFPRFHPPTLHIDNSLFSLDNIDLYTLRIAKLRCRLLSDYGFFALDENRGPVIPDQVWLKDFVKPVLQSICGDFYDQQIQGIRDFLKADTRRFRWLDCPPECVDIIASMQSHDPGKFKRATLLSSPLERTLHALSTCKKNNLMEKVWLNKNTRQINQHLYLDWTFSDFEPEFFSLLVFATTTSPQKERLEKLAQHILRSLTNLELFQVPHSSHFSSLLLYWCEELRFRNIYDPWLQNMDAGDLVQCVVINYERACLFTSSVLSGFRLLGKLLHNGNKDMLDVDTCVLVTAPTRRIEVSADWTIIHGLVSPPRIDEPPEEATLQRSFSRLYIDEPPEEATLQRSFHDIHMDMNMNRLPKEAKCTVFKEAKCTVFKDLKGTDLAGENDNECVICLTNRPCVVFVPCYHKHVCIACCLLMREPQCPVCKGTIKEAGYVWEK